jgi:hypothetical protein
MKQLPTVRSAWILSTTNRIDDGDAEIWLHAPAYTADISLLGDAATSPKVPRFAHLLLDIDSQTLDSWVHHI